MVKTVLDKNQIETVGKGKKFVAAKKSVTIKEGTYKVQAVKRGRDHHAGRVAVDVGAKLGLSAEQMRQASQKVA
ncbi:MAG: hypothetical protein FWE17_00700 [Alphaproteobacteria bacterium]|nr:hypothetical protein [Alphaproteobacteria bacterium]MCL2758032.1 hypothetical protein [Alphaproteobacteria bacterium]